MELISNFNQWRSFTLRGPGGNFLWAGQCSQIVDGIYLLHSTSLLQKKQFFKYNLGKFLKYITFLSSSLIIFESLPKLYLKNCFFSIKCQNRGGKFHPRSGSSWAPLTKKNLNIYQYISTFNVENIQ